MTTYLITFGCHAVQDMVRNQGCKCLYIITGLHRLARFSTAKCTKHRRAAP